MANEFKVKNGLIVVGDLTTSGTITINGALAATQSWVTSQAYLTSASLSGYATQSYVTSAIASLVDSAPAALDTLKELATALGNDASFATTVTNSIASKLSLSGGTLTGLLTAPKLALTTTGNDYYLSLNGLTMTSITTGETIWRNLSSFRFSDVNDWDYNSWAGLKFINSTKQIVLGVAGNVFTANSPQTGTLLLDRIATVYVNNTSQTVWHSGNLTNLNQLTNGPGYLTSYTETDTLASVTGRGATTNTSITVGPDLTVQADGSQNYTASRLWLNSHNNYRGAGVHMSGTGSTWFAGTPYTDFDGGYVIARTSTSNDVSSAQYSNALLTVKSNGNVGIGTGSPSYKLDVNGSFNAVTSGVSLTYNSGIIYHGGSYYQFPSGSYYYLYGRTGMGLIFGSNNAEVGRFDLSGNLGIGTTNPAFPLHVARSSGDSVIVADSGASSNSQFRFQEAGSLAAAITFVSSDDSLRFYNGGDRFTILSTGNVGIGTTNPIYKLQVVGSAYVNGGTLFLDSSEYLRWGNSNQGIVGVNDSHVAIVSGGATRQTIYADGRTYFPGLDLSISNVNSTGSSNYFRGDASHFVLGTGGTLYLNYANTSGSTYIFGTTYINNNVVWHAGNFTPGNYLPLSGGTLTGQLSVHYTNGRISIGNGTDNLIMGAWDGVNQRLESNTRPIYIVSYGGTVSLGRAGGNSLVVNTNSLTYGGVEIATQNYVNTTVESYTSLQSQSDFVDGTLVITSINASVTNGNSFVMEVSGKSYSGGHSPYKLTLQGYIYADTFISNSAISYGTTFPGPVKILEYGGNLAFWWPRGSYWNSFDVYVRIADGGNYKTNTVTSIINSAEPSSSKKVSVTPFQSWTNWHFGQSDINNWNTAYSWGNHATAGYLTSVSDVWVNTTGDTMTGDLTFANNADNVRINKNNNWLNLYDPWNNIHLRNGNSGYGIYIDSTIHYWRPHDGSAYLMTLSSTGLGIGTGSPSYKLDVAGITRFQNRVRFANDLWNLSDDGYSRLYFSTNGRTYYGSGDGHEWRSAADTSIGFLTNAGNLILKGTNAFTTGGTATLSVIGDIISFGASDSELSYFRRVGTGQFQWQTYSSGNNGQIHLQPYGGNVGIGTTSPSEKLHVSGAAIFDGGAGNSSTDSVVYITKSNNNDWGLYVNASGLDYGMYTRVSPSAGYAIGVNNGTDWTTRITGNAIIYLGEKNAIEGNYDTWLRLNNSNHYASGVYTPGVMRADGGFNVNGSAVIHSGTIGSQSVNYANSAGYAGYVNNQAGQLLRYDNRTISPSETNAGYLQFGFTSWDNNGGSPYADYLHMRSYDDGSGGNDNLVMFLKSGIGMRIWQQSFGSSSAYSSYADVWTTVNFTQSNVNNWNTAYGWGNHASQSYATTSYVTTQINNLINGAPGALDTLSELASALGNDASFATTVTNSIASKLSLSGGTMTGQILFQTSALNNGFRWDVNSDAAGITFKNTGDGDNNSYFNFFTEDNGNEYFKFSHNTWNIGSFDFMDVKNGVVRTNGNIYVNASQSGTRSAGTNELINGNRVWHDGDFSSSNISNWNTAYGWGDHSSVGYALNSSLANYLPLSGGVIGGAVTINGNLTVNGTITENSSIKLKENIETSEGNLEKVVNLRPVTYNKIGSQTTELGLIAEEVAEVYPEFVQYDENGEPVGVHYSRLTAALIGAVKELTNQVQELNKKING